MDRREFLNTAMAGAGLALLPGAVLPAATASDAKLHVALIGHGKQGQVLFNAMRNIPGLHFQAVCDIWDYNRKGAAGHVRALQRHLPTSYEDIDELLATEKGLDAAIIATPDFWHAQHTVKCLEAGLHVYCEKVMSNTLEGARTMVQAVEKSGKLCQIGYQRRSNPRYLYTLDQLFNGLRIFGQIVNVRGQWYRSLNSSKEALWNPRVVIKPDILNRYGFKDMRQFMNWRYFRDLSGGLILDLGSHHIDVFNWFLGSTPKSVCAFGSNDYFKEREHFDNLMAVFEYDTPQGILRACEQVVTASPGTGGYFESFMGTTCTLQMSESPTYTNISPHNYRPTEGPNWDDLLDRGFLKEKDPPPRYNSNGQIIRSHPSQTPPPDLELPGTFNKPPHQPHLENFFAAVRGETTLNCDARCAFASEAPMHSADPSARTRQTITFEKID